MGTMRGTSGFARVVRALAAQRFSSTTRGDRAQAAPRDGGSKSLSRLAWGVAVKYIPRGGWQDDTHVLVKCECSPSVCGVRGCVLCVSNTRIKYGTASAFTASNESLDYSMAL